MSAGEASQPEKHPIRFLLFFLVALAFSLGLYGANYVFQIYFARFSILGGAFDPGLFILIQSIISFVVSPIGSFYVFYKIGTKVSVRGPADYFRILSSTFTGGLAGSTLAFLSLLDYGSSIAGPYTDWPVWVASYSLILVRGGIDFAFIGFTGALVGVLRSHRQSTGEIAAAVGQPKPS